MSKQDISLVRTKKQNEILDLECKYFTIMERIITSSSFREDLLKIEKEIRENYPKFKDTWKIKNKLKIPAERLVRHHVYTQLHDLITGVYASPISSDLGVVTNECVLCVDIKTIDTHSNKGDLNSTAIEQNQISFDNSHHKYVSTVSNLDSIDHYLRIPVLTYIVKIVYTDDNYSFKLSRNEYPTLVLCCIPNGELSNLFGNDIIENFKTYDYYSRTDGDEYEELPIPSNIKKAQQKVYVDNVCKEKGFVPVVIDKKTAYYDPVTRVTWWDTSKNNLQCIRAVKSGGSTRVYNKYLKERYDSMNNSWVGYKEYTIDTEKP